MEFSLFLLFILPITVSGQWSASVIPMVPNSGSLGQGMLSQSIQPMNSFRMDQMNGFQNFRQFNTFPLNNAGNFGGYGPIQPQQMPVMSMQQNPFMGNPGFQRTSFMGNPGFQQGSFAGNSGFQQGSFAGNPGFQMMPRNFANHPRALGSPQFNPMVSGFNENSRPEQVAKRNSEGSLPKFLEGADEITIKEFKRIIRQPNMTYENKIKQVDELVQTLDESKQILYKQFMREGDELEGKRRAEIHKTVSVMSEDAQKIFAKISAILTNPQMPEEERWSRILTIYGNIDPKLRNEFENKFKPLV
ncbi:hypothetical protein FO519_007970 [Halicephalobus sp. NKZ332]|nr:hypothetical protein FO519_007970 [Halicephalobus sp. NKZ332]